VVGWLLERAHDVTMAALTGIMVGALRQPGTVVWESRPDGEANSYWLIVAGVGLIGAGIVLGLHFVDSALQKRRIVPADSQES
jgi:uncharacterized membrane protein